MDKGMLWTKFVPIEAITDKKENESDLDDTPLPFQQPAGGPSGWSR